MADPKPPMRVVTENMIDCRTITALSEIAPSLRWEIKEAVEAVTRPSIGGMPLIIKVGTHKCIDPTLVELIKRVVTPTEGALYYVVAYDHGEFTLKFGCGKYTITQRLLELDSAVIKRAEMILEKSKSTAINILREKL